MRREDETTTGSVFWGFGRVAFKQAGLGLTYLLLQVWYMSLRSPWQRSLLKCLLESMLIIDLTARVN